jgi:hypothetical protein
MKRETIEKIFNFLEETEGKVPYKWIASIKELELIKELENHSDGTQFRYEGNLSLGDSNITKLPDNLYVDGYLILFNCQQLKELPDNLYVDTNLYLDRTNIEEIPNHLYVGGHLSIIGTPLAKKYTDERIYELIKLRGGIIKRKIHTK